MTKLARMICAATALGVLATGPEARAAEPAPASPAACAAHADVVRKLADRFGETLTSLGMHKDDSVVEVFTSSATGTWTIVVTGADGVSCLLAAGQRWQPDAVPAPRAGSAANAGARAGSAA